MEKNETSLWYQKQMITPISWCNASFQFFKIVSLLSTSILFSVSTDILPHYDKHNTQSTYL